MRIGSIIIFHLSKLWKATKFFILCDVILLVRLEEKFGIDHWWPFSRNCIRPGSDSPSDPFSVTRGEGLTLRVTNILTTCTPRKTRLDPNSCILLSSVLPRHGISFDRPGLSRSKASHTRKSPEAGNHARLLTELRQKRTPHTIMISPEITLPWLHFAACTGGWE